MNVDEVFQRALGYTSDPEHEDRDPGDTVARWLDANPSIWRVNRELEFNLEPNQLVVLLVGEEGAGKTTALRAQAEVIEAEPSNLLFRIDFSSATMLVNAKEAEAHVRALDKEVQLQVEKKLFRSDMWPQYMAAWSRESLLSATGNNSETDRLRLHLPEKVLRQMSDEEILAHKGLGKLARNARNQRTALGSAALAMAARIPGVRVFLHVDNIDHLPRPLIRSTLATLSTLIVGDTICHIAMRPENEELYTAFRQRRETRISRLDSDVSFIDLGERRIAAAVQFVQANQPADSRAAQEHARVLTKQLRNVSSDKPALNLIQNWQNGNLRHMLSFVGRLWAENTGERSTRGLVYSYLIRSSTPRYLFQIFNPSRIETHRFSTVRFVFLHLRILSYVHRLEQQTCLQDALLADFKEAFDLPHARVLSAIEALTFKRGNGGAPLRVDPVSGEILLLPAGRVFMDLAVYSCDFLSWIYDESAADLPPVEERGRSQTKFDKAVAVLTAKLLPAFLAEHPYMRPTRAITPEERVRLRAYVSLFNFGPGRWFLSRMMDELEEYADAPKRTVDKRSLIEARHLIEPLLGQLDKIIANEA